ncbi:MAG: matrixin family metalloprotease [Nibricoccus sp.]
MISKSLLFRLALALVAVSNAWGFTFLTNNNTKLPIKWPAGSVTFQVALGTSTSLSDGNTYNSSVQSAMNTWNAQLGAFQFQGQSVAPGSAGNGNNRNELVFSSTVYGTAFDTNVLAVTTTWSSGNDRVEADVIFNSARTWDSYRGSTRGSVVDIQRVAIHELGHALGLDHPDENGQSVSAIMNSHISNIDTMTADDISGAQQLYGPPGIPANDNFANATTILLNGGTAQLTGFNTNCTKQSGEPLHASNAGGRSAWWRWTAPANGSAALNTQGSIFDTTLGVYTGASVNALATIASNDDFQSGVIQYSTVTFSPVAGTTYYFAVDGFDADSGAVGLNLSFTASQYPVTVGHSISFSAGAGNSFQWQISTDGGATWSNLSDNGIYSGTTTATLTITNASSSLNGTRFRALTTTGTTVTTGISFTLTVAPALVPNPTGIVSDSAGNLTVADSSLNTLQKITPEGVVTAFAGSSNQAGATDAVGTAARFNQPSALALSSSILFAADTGNATIRRVATDGTVTTFAGSSSVRGNNDATGTAATFSAPAGLAFDSAGNLYVADETNHTIRKITSAGVVTTFAGAASASGTTNGTPLNSRFNRPKGLVFDSLGNLYVTDSFNHTIRKIPATGSVTTWAGLEGVSGTSDGSAALFSNPTGLARDSSGNLYVADTANSTIRKITPAGVVSTFAGLPTISGLKDGTGTDAWFNHPQAIAVDGSNNLYVADTGNAAIRKITPGGVVTTLTLSDGSVVTPPVTPSPPAAASSGGGGGGGGGGAPTGAFFAALALISVARLLRR